MLAAAAPVAAAPPEPAPSGDDDAIEKAIHASIGWALTKDRALLESLLAHDEALFNFHPDAATTVVGWDSMARLFTFWMDPRSKATSYDTRDLRVNLSCSGDVSRFSAILDDCAKRRGKPSCWKDTRWTSVLEKHDGRWVIVQMHFSFATSPRAAGRTKPTGEDG